MTAEHFSPKEPRQNLLSRILHPVGRVSVATEVNGSSSVTEAQATRTQSLLEEVTENTQKLSIAAEELHQTIEEAKRTFAENERYDRTSVPDLTVQPTLFEIKGEPNG